MCHDVRLPTGGKITEQQNALLALVHPKEDRERDRARRELVLASAIPRRVYVAIGSEMQFGCPDEKLVALIRQQLGKGSLGTVYDACSPEGNCRFVLKVQLSGGTPETDPGPREVAISNIIMSKRANQDIIVPVLDSRRCQNLFLTKYDKWDMDGEKLGAKQWEAQFKLSASRGGGEDGSGEKQIDYLLYTEHQMQQFFVLAHRLTAIGIAHGDLKPDNYLYKAGKDGEPDRLAIADLGFSGSYDYGQRYMPLWGFSRGDAHCPDVMTLDAARFANTWQILFRFGTYAAVIVAIGDPSRPPLEYRLFEGLGQDYERDLPNSARAALHRTCTAVVKSTSQAARSDAAARRKAFAHFKPYFLTWPSASSSSSSRPGR